MATTKDDGENESLSQFLVALGGSEHKGVKAWAINETTRERSYCGLREIPNNDFDDFIEIFRADYPKGGYFYFTLMKPNGTPAGNVSMRLDALPERLQKKPAPDQGATTRRSMGGMDDYMLMMFDRQDRDAARAERQRTQMLDGVFAIVTAGITAWVKSGGKLGGNDGNSPAELLNQIIDAKKKMDGNDGETNILKTLEIIGKIKELNQDPEPAKEGFMGTLERMAPVIMNGMVQQAALAQQQPQPPAPAQPGQRPAVAQVQRPPNLATPAGAAPPNEMQQLIAKYTPLMRQIKALLDKGNSADTIADFVDMQILSEAISGDDVDALLDRFEQYPEAFAPTLTIFGIAAEHHRTVADAIALLIQGVDADDKGQGGQGDAPSLTDNGGLDGQGVPVNGHSAQGDIAH